MNTTELSILLPMKEICKHTHMSIEFVFICGIIGLRNTYLKYYEMIVWGFLIRKINNKLQTATAE